MKRSHLALIALALGGCSRASGPTGEPVDRMFDASYEKFIHAAKAHTGKCESGVAAKGDGGTKRDAVESSLEVDAEGSFRVHADGGLELVRVGSVIWQREKEGKFERIESGARAELMRDHAIAGWRNALAPLRERMTLTRAETTKLGEREIEVYTISVEPGGGNDGGVQVSEGKGAVGLDAETGFPVKFEFTGEWEGPATPPAEGRVTWTVEKMECAIEIPAEPMETITPAIATPTPTPAQTAAPATTATATPAKPAKTPTPVPTISKGTKTKLKIK